MKALIGIIVLLIIGVAAFTIYDSQTAVPVPDGSTGTTTALEIPVIIAGTPSVMYRDPQYAFSIYYPSTALLTSDNIGGFLPLTQSPVIGFSLNSDMFQGTNLGEAGVYIGATTSPGIVSSCVSPSSSAGETTATSSISIGGSQFSEFDSTGVGAGNIYEEKAFRTVENGACLEIVELLHSSQIANYPAGSVVAYDHAKFSGILDAMVGTFAFTKPATK